MHCRYESLGVEGYHSLFRWYQAFEATHFPDPVGLRETVAKWTLGLYPNCLKFTMAIFDVPESIAVTRKLLCTSGLASLTRIQVCNSSFSFPTLYSSQPQASASRNHREGPPRSFLPENLNDLPLSPNQLIMQHHQSLFCGEDSVDGRCELSRMSAMQLVT